MAENNLLSKPHIFNRNGKWVVAFKQGAYVRSLERDGLIDAFSIALNVLSWEKHQCSGAHEGSPLHKKWRSYQSHEILNYWDTREERRKEEERKTSKVRRIFGAWI